MASYERCIVEWCRKPGRDAALGDGDLVIMDGLCAEHARQVEAAPQEWKIEVAPVSGKLSLRVRHVAQNAVETDGTAQEPGREGAP